ncbi:baculoviral IAP repeat-containing protein 5.1-like [Notechis scutatus]|uniref:Baculoviral IAP repeat-containing protein 5.1-like n=1 Tax=Notechis scutatus TaxID=8663 RepID=A0A6J1U589_9SAUR|nr:baculoviral IAP repeat-containing protein 5.1-like [Notechis scutatus]XP_026523773.1 baculoviral IAP repeat-containing protein 5.1-like [Notechis scutatus]
MEAFLREITSTSKNLLDFREMYDYRNRLQTLTAWPFKDNCKCTPENMAKAGFIHHLHAEELDVAKCFFCLIELEGWESNHDPWLEHSKRSQDSCGFLSLSKNFDDLTVEEYYELEMERVRNFLCKTGRSIINTFEKEAALTRKRLVDHFMNKYQYTPEAETSAVCNKRKLCTSQQMEENGLQLTVSCDDKHGQR